MGRLGRNARFGKRAPKRHLRGASKCGPGPAKRQQRLLTDLHLTQHATASAAPCRYRNQFMTSALNEELKYCQQAVKPLLAALQRINAALPAAAADAAAAPAPLRLLLSSARLACRVFFSLNSPGLTEVRSRGLPGVSVRCVRGAPLARPGTPVPARSLAPCSPCSADGRPVRAVPSRFRAVPACRAHQVLLLTGVWHPSLMQRATALSL